MARKRILIAGAVVAALALATGAGVARAAGGDDGNGSPITGDALAHASKVALSETGGGRVTATEVNDEEGKYEVEVTLNNGHQVDVHLDTAFKVIDHAADHGDGEGSDAGN
ncbi:MAG TPA: hypothetical protein VKB57_09495 [Acidimicrobiales bacterium]|nr:hypothetical protein [Acidimicrobiales bacterium]